MPISLHEATAARFAQVLAGAERVLTRGRDHVAETGGDLDEIVEARLFPDMLPFRFQVVSLVHHSRGAIEAVEAGVFSPPTRDSTLDYAGLLSLVTQARGFVEQVDPAVLNAVEGRPLAFRGAGLNMDFLAHDFLLTFSLPNFFFHAATAYDILRHRGVPLSKRDYLGPYRKIG